MVETPSNGDLTYGVLDSGDSRLILVQLIQQNSDQAPNRLVEYLGIGRSTDQSVFNYVRLDEKIDGFEHVFVIRSEMSFTPTLNLTTRTNETRESSSFLGVRRSDIVISQTMAT
jgi:hypothetical protein